MAKLRFIQALTGFAGPILSLALHFAVTLCYINRWDKVTAVTVFPLWSWALVGILIILFSWIFARNKFGILVASVWAITALVGADEIPGIVHSINGKNLPAQHPLTHDVENTAGEITSQPVIRIATINCKNRQQEALLEARSYSPDVILIQESPHAGTLRKLAREFFGDEGHWAGGGFCGIISKGELKLVHNSVSPRFTHATLTLRDGRSIDLVSVHLKHAITRWDLWNRGCWQTHYANRKVRRAELIQILTHVSKTHHTRPVIFGGDFNAPASDAVYNILRDHFLDGYRAAGSGWGNTFFNRLPVLRIDQLWSTPPFLPLNARAFPTKNSDHRILLCDYILN